VATALLLMDTQVPQFERMGNDELVDRLVRARESARTAGIHVIFVRIAFRPGHPEVSPANATFQTIADNGAYVEDDAGTAIHPALTPADGDLVVTKRRVSAFAGSDLEVVLRANRVDTLVLTGIATSGVVLSTFTQAADLDYRLVILTDACADADPDVHRVLTEKYFPRRADVLTVDEWAARLQSTG
jgi:nicotinamidase-related amidase